MLLLWISANTFFSVLLSAILVHKLVNWRDQFNCAERIGMGVMAGAVLLTIPILWTYESTPFDYWSATILRLGAVVYFLGRLSRHYRHWRRNEETKRQAMSTRRPRS